MNQCSQRPEFIHEWTFLSKINLHRKQQLCVTYNYSECRCGYVRRISLGTRWEIIMWKKITAVLNDVKQDHILKMQEEREETRKKNWGREWSYLLKESRRRLKQKEGGSKKEEDWGRYSVGQVYNKKTWPGSRIWISGIL